MAQTTPMTLPVVLRVGNTEGAIGHIEVPLAIATTPTSRQPDGALNLPVTVDLDAPELRRRIAAFLREAADAFEEVPVDADR